jgi:hypothetical protein
MSDLHRNKDASWMTSAACNGYPAEWFFPLPGQPAPAAARELCLTACPVTAACLAYAMTEPVETEGLWGGKSKSERRRMRGCQR